VETATKKPLEEYGQEFPVTQKYIFLDHAAVAPLNLRAKRAVEQFIEENNTLGAERHRVWNERVEKVRRSAANLIGAKPSEIAFVPNTSTGINIIAQGLKWFPGENVITLKDEFPANVYPWMNLAKKGVELRFVPDKKGRITPADISRKIDSHTKLLSVSSVGFLTGFRNDLEKIGSMCASEGILFHVDAIQSLGAFPVDVKKARIDFLSADSHKWLLGPEGIGVMYVSENFKDRVNVTFAGWKSVKNPTKFLPYNFDIKEDASRFEPGSLNLMGIFAMGESISMIEEIGVENIARKIIGLTDHMAQGLSKRGWEVLSPRNEESEKSGIVSFNGAAPPHQVVERLEKKGVIIATRGGILRASPHFYNTFEETDYFLEALGNNRGRGL